MKINFKQVVPYLIIVISFIVISFIYFYPVIEGKVMSQSDTNHAIGTSQELKTFEDQTGEYSQWTNSIFGGMPAYNIRSGKTFNVYYYLNVASLLGLPYYTVAILFLYLLGFFVLLISLKVDKWLSAVGAVAFALSSYNIIIIVAGHITKAYAIGLMAPALAGVILLYDKKYLLGGLLTTISLGMQLAKNHPQISYYLIILLGIVVVTEFFILLKKKDLKHFFIATSIIVLAGIFALLPNITQTWTTYEYQKYSIRGASELASEAVEGKTSTGLDKDYALAWSYGVGETLTLLIPNAKGGASGYLSANETAVENASGDFKDAILQQNQYWGDQPFTSGPVYYGAIIMFLFILGLFIVDNKLKWGLLAATILSILLSWGSNFEAFTNFFFYNVPLYNKFRTVSMTLVISSVTIPLLAILAVKEFIEKPEIFKTKIYEFLAAFVITGGIALVLWIAPNILNFLSLQEISYFDSMKAQSADYATQIDAFLKGLEAARVAVFKADAIRSFAFILLGAGTLTLFGIGKIKKELLIGVLGLLFIFDLWIIDRRYLSANDFVKKSKAEEVFKASVADEIILKDKDPDYRVVNLNYSLDGDGYTSYFHKTISGYHGAKLRRYQDIISTYLNPSIQMITNAIQNDSVTDIYAVLSSLDVLNMLNTRYIIYNENEFPLVNMNAYGNAWFVEKLSFVETADSELETLGSVDLKRTAVINKSTFSDYIDDLPQLSLANLDTGIITLTDYKPNHLTYKTSSRKDEFAVFSEIYYPKGWDAYIDGQKVEHISVNYILRGLSVPAGDHVIEFKFEPSSYYTGKKIALISSILIILVILGAVVWTFYSKKNLKNNPDEKEENSDNDILVETNNQTDNKKIKKDFTKKKK